MRVRLRSLYFPFLPLRSENYLEEGKQVRCGTYCIAQGMFVR